MEDLIIKLCKNNVCTYLTKMQDMQNENDSLQRNGIKYYKQRFLTLTFDDLGKTAGDLFVDVNIQRSGWVKKPLDFNNCTFIADMIKLYMNYKSTNEWDNQGDNHNKVLVALATDLKEELSKKKNIPGNPTSSATNNSVTEPGNSTVPPAWKSKNVDKTTT